MPGARDAARLGIDLGPGFGTLAWMVARYKRSAHWKKVSERSRPEYERTLNMVLRHKLKTGAELGTTQCTKFDAQAVDKLYEALQKGPRVERRLRTANLCMILTARVWDKVHRLYPKVVPQENPFRGVEMEYGNDTAQAASRSEAYALHAALIAAGEPHLAAVPLICFEWHQRPEYVLSGYLTWANYRPSTSRNTVTILHHKTGKQVPMPLSDREGPLFPELVAYLDGLERLGIPIVLMKPQRLRGGAQVAPPVPSFCAPPASAFARPRARLGCRII